MIRKSHAIFNSRNEPTGPLVAGASAIGPDSMHGNVTLGLAADEAGSWLLAEVEFFPFDADEFQEI
jgi:hypothetical protein